MASPDPLPLRRHRLSPQDALALADFGQNAEHGWHLVPGAAVEMQPAATVWYYVLKRARRLNPGSVRLTIRQIEALGYMCFGAQAEFAHECWSAGTVESLRDMLSIVHQQAIEGLLISRKVATLMRWTRTGKPVSHKNAQQHARDGLKRLGLNREELLVMLGRGILDRIEWTQRGRWKQNPR